MHAKLPKLLVSLFIVCVTACSYKSKSSYESQGYSSPQKPNIIMILIDDLGYTDIGVFGGNIDTPNIDALAQQGVLFTNAHANPSCAPTRAALITGKDPHRVGLGSQNGIAPPGVPTTRLGYKGSLEGQFIGLAQVMKQGGYDTYQVGKWHLGKEADQSPGSLGFDHYFTLLDGAASHYSDRSGISLAISPTGKATYVENGLPVTILPDDFYSTQYYTQWLLDSLKGRENTGKPFFAYLAFTAVHDPLHAPEGLISKYETFFKDGFDVLKEKRIQSLIEQGLISDSPVMTRWLKGTPAWDELSGMQQKDMAKRMAVYAAMLEYLDMEIGRLVSFLEDTGEYDNTLIVVMSDNGAATVPKTFYTKSKADQDWQDKAYPLESLSDYGKKGSFTEIGTYNAQAVSGPYFGFKTSLFEGGTRVPLVVKVPGVQKKNVNRQFTHISDLYTTFADYAGVDLTGQQELIGCSLKPAIQSQAEQACHKEFGMAYMGWRAYWQGPWKLVFVSESFGGTGKSALYNLEQDPGEVNDLSKEYPEKVKELSDKWLAYAEENGIEAVAMKKVNTAFDTVSNRFFDIYWGQ